MIKKILKWSLGLSAVIFIGLVIAGYGLEKYVLAKTSPDSPPARKPDKEPTAQIVQLASRLKSQAPQGIYLVIDTAGNRLYVMQNEKIKKEAIVSCGSGDILEEPGGTRKWIFDTPRGEFNVNSKLINPTWIKPDWAFIEEGEKPPTDYNARIDNDSLGDYALGFGEGYFIHGTLYTRLIGRNVTHGCVRVGDQDLKEIFQIVPIGARVYIY